MATGRHLEALSPPRSLCYLAVNLGITLMSPRNLNYLEQFEIKPEMQLLTVVPQLLSFNFNNFCSLEII